MLARAGKSGMGENLRRSFLDIGGRSGPVKNARKQYGAQVVVSRTGSVTRFPLASPVASTRPARLQRRRFEGAAR
jgi:hypothetical protein